METFFAIKSNFLLTPFKVHTRHDVDVTCSDCSPSYWRNY